MWPRGNQHTWETAIERNPAYEGIFPPGVFASCIWDLETTDTLFGSSSDELIATASLAGLLRPEELRRRLANVLHVKNLASAPHGRERARLRPVQTLQERRSPTPWTRRAMSISAKKLWHSVFALPAHPQSLDTGRMQCHLSHEFPAGKTIVDIISSHGIQPDVGPET